MPQRGADGLYESSGYSYGCAAARSAGAPWGWVNRDWSPEQKERYALKRARQVDEAFLVAQRENGLGWG